MLRVVGLVQRQRPGFAIDRSVVDSDSAVGITVVTHQKYSDISMPQVFEGMRQAMAFEVSVVLRKTCWPQLGQHPKPYFKLDLDLEYYDNFMES